jgi:hypothetical protein
MRNRFAKRRFADAERLRGNSNPPAVKRPQGNAEPVAFGAHPVVGADEHVVEIDVAAPQAAYAERVHDLPTAHAGRVDGDQERGHAPATDACRGRREHHQHIGRLGIRDPYLATSDPVSVSVPLGRRALLAGVRTGVRRRQREGAECLAGRQPPEPPIALHRAAKVCHQLCDQGIVHREDDRECRAGARDLLDGEGVAHVVMSNAAVGRVNGDPHQSARGATSASAN